MNAWLEINLSHLTHNLRVIRKKARFAKDIIAVVKANAYGHGLELVTKKLFKEKIRWFAVMDMEEAEKIHTLFPQANIIFLRSLFEKEVAFAIKKEWRFFVSSINDLKEVVTISSRLKKKTFIHLKIDTGLSRLGILYGDKVIPFLKIIQKSSYLNLEGIASHFASAASDRKFSLVQKRRLEGILKTLPPLSIVHMVNSSALDHPELFIGNVVRIGASLYGFSPHKSKTAENLGLRPVLSWKTRLLLVKKLPPNTSVGYDRTYRTKKSQKIGILPLGYHHGLNLRLSNLGKVLIHGKPHHIIGRIAMNLTTIALHNSPGYEKDDEVVIIGRQKNNSITLESQAKLLQTIPYEICSTISQNIKRIPKQ